MCTGPERSAVVRSGLLRPLVALLRRSNEPRLLREGARVLAALASEPAATSALLREDAPRALRHLCRSKAVQSHGLAVRALGRLARTEGTLLEAHGLGRIFCAVASSSVLDARAAAAAEITLLLMLPSHRAPLLACGVVGVLLSCCESLNEALKLSALHALALLLAGASIATTSSPSTSPAQLQLEEDAAVSSRLVATQHLASHAGVATLCALGGDESARVREGAIQCIEFLARDPIHHPTLEQVSALKRPSPIRGPSPLP